MTDQPQIELTEDERKLIEAYRVGNLPDAMRVYKRKHHGIMEPEEAKRAEPIQRGDNGQVSGYGWYAERHLTVRSNNRDDLANIPDEIADYAHSPLTYMENFEIAVGVVGKLVQDGFFKINFDNYPDWHEDFKMCVESILEVLNRH